ncbi:MAG: ferredoxin [Mycobacterium sp.]|nr:ferredoxin [Mycobacterium sp.]
MEITIDVDKCCAAGQCVLAAPDIFDQRDDDGVAILLDSNPAAELHQAARDAAAVCPAMAILVRE